LLAGFGWSGRTVSCRPFSGLNRVELELCLQRVCVNAQADAIALFDALNRANSPFQVLLLLLLVISI
jgi:hypothetical protein